MSVNGGTLGGIGSITGGVTVNSGGILSPGESIKSLASGALTFNTGSTFAYGMNSNFGSAVAADLQIVNGNVGSTHLCLNGIVKLILADATSE